MRTNHTHSAVQDVDLGPPPDFPPLVPPRTPSPEAPPVVAPMIYVKKSVKWEYRQLIRNLSKEAAPTADELNTLGQEGWELTGVTTDAPFVYFYFKRLMG